MTKKAQPALLLLNQMAGPMTWELAEDLGKALGCVALLTGHPDTLKKEDANVQLFAATGYERGNFARRAWTWLRYSWQAFWWIRRYPATTPLLLFSNPPILVWVGWLLALLRGQRYAVMVHDIYPDVLVRTQILGEQHPLIQLWRWLNRHAYERAAVVMTLGEYMAANLAQQFDPQRTLAGKIELIPPWVDTDVIKPIPKAENWFAKKYNQVDKLTVMYSGNMGIGHDIETIVEAARQLRHREDIHFMFIGAGPKWKVIDRVLQQEALPNMTLLGWQPESVIPFSLSTADIALVSLEVDFESVMIPSKGVYSLASGTSIFLLSSGPNELGRWISENQLGQKILPGDSTGLVRVIIEAKDANLSGIYKANARNFSTNSLSRIFCTKKIAELIDMFFSGSINFTYTNSDDLC